MTAVTFRNESVEEIIAKQAGWKGIEWGDDVHVPVGDNVFVSLPTQKLYLTFLRQSSKV